MGMCCGNSTQENALTEEEMFQLIAKRKAEQQKATESIRMMNAMKENLRGAVASKLNNAIEADKEKHDKIHAQMEEIRKAKLERNTLYLDFSFDSPEMNSRCSLMPLQELTFNAVRTFDEEEKYTKEIGYPDWFTSGQRDFYSKMHDFIDLPVEEKMNHWRVDLDCKKYPCLTKKEALINVTFKILLAFDHIAWFTQSMADRTPILERSFDITSTLLETHRIWVKALKLSPMFTNSQTFISWLNLSSKQKYCTKDQAK